MRIFVTGASGFVGSAIVDQLLQSGHQVLGLVRTDSAAKALEHTGAEAYFGNLDDHEGLQRGAAQCDAVIHTAFNHDFSRFKASCEDDRLVIKALGAPLAGSNRPLVVTSGVGLLNYKRILTENDLPPSSGMVPRAASEEATRQLGEQGVKTFIVRLAPTTHGRGDHGFVPFLIDKARQTGKSAYVGNGENRWPAVHRVDAAALYRLIVEKQPAQQVFHAVAETGIPFRQIAETIAKRLGAPAVSMTAEEAQDHFGWFAYFAGIDCPASTELTRKTLDWIPTQQTLMTDLESNYF